MRFGKSLGSPLNTEEVRVGCVGGVECVESGGYSQGLLNCEQKMPCWPLRELASVLAQHFCGIAGCVLVVDVPD